MVRATIRDETPDQIHVETEYRDRLRIKSVPNAKWDPDVGQWRLPLTWASCLRLRGTFGDALDVDQPLVEWSLREKAERVDPATSLRDQMEIDSPEIEEIEDGSDLKLFGFQRVGTLFMARARSAILADEMGLGKTPQTIRAIQLLGDEALPALVVSPNSMKYTWGEEFKRWAPELDVVVIDGTPSTRRDQIASGADVIVLNWALLRRHSKLAAYGSAVHLKKCEEHARPGDEPDVKTAAACHVHEKELNEVEWATIVLDEAHNAARPRSQRTRAAWWLGDRARYRFALTGTPIVNSTEDYWSLLRFVSPDEWSTKTAYIDRYCLSSWGIWGGIDVVGLKPENRVEFFKITDPRMLRRTKRVAQPQMPEKIFSERLVPLRGDRSVKQERAYNEMADQMIAMLDEGVLVSTSPLVQTTRLLQLASAYGETEEYTNSDGEEKTRLNLTMPSNKVSALEELVEEMAGDPLVVFAVSRQLIDLAAEMLDKNDIEYGRITGSDPVADRQRYMAEFQDGNLQVMLATVGAGGEGVTLTAASTVAFLQRPWSPAKRSQAIDRVHRIGQENTVQVIDFISSNTIEHAQLEVLAGKEVKFQEIVRDEETMRRLLEHGRE